MTKQASKQAKRKHQWRKAEEKGGWKGERQTGKGRERGEREKERGTEEGMR